VITPGHLLRRVAGALVAQTVLAALLVGLPWGLGHYIGWPLPDHLPSFDELETVLLSPLSTPLLLDLLSCIAWPCWAIFVIDVARCVPDVLRGVRIPSLGPVHALAAFLLTATVLGFLGPRTPTTGPTSLVSAAQLAQVGAADHVASAPPSHPGIVVVRAPHHGIYDSLWRIADRELGDGARWTDIWDRNKGQPQTDGHVFTNPHLIHPGWTLQLPDTPRVPPSHDHEVDEHNVDHPGPSPATPPTTPPLASRPPATPPSLSPPPTQAPTAAPHLRLHPGTGITVATGAFVGLGLAALITATLITVRLWRRRIYQPGSGERAEATAAPVVRALRIAYDQATVPHDDEGVLIFPEPASTAAGSDVAARDRAHTTAEAILPAGNDTVLGVRDGHAVALDLTCTRGLGLVGPGAHAATRALIVSVLAEAQRRTPGDVTVVVPARDVATLLGTTAAVEHPPARLRIVPDLDAALNVLEAELLTRTRHATDQQTADTPAGALVLAATPAPHTERRLQAVLDNGSTLGLAGVLIGQWRPGGTIRVRTDGTIAATSPHLTDTLAGARLFTLPTTDTSGLLDLLGAADTPAQHAPTRPTNPPRSPAAPPPAPRVRVDIPRAMPPPASDQPPDQAPAPIPDTDTSADPPAPSPAHASPDPAPADHAHDRQDTAEVPLELTVLGRLHLYHRHTHGRADLIDALAPKQREILVHLALYPNGARRETLTTAIWPDAPGDRPYNSFHATLSQLRRALRKATNDAITDLAANHDGHYSLDRTLITVDLWQLQDALHHYRHISPERQRLDALNRVANLYQGNLADGLTAEWLDAPREALRRDVLDALSALIQAIGDDQPDRTLSLLEQARRLDPYNEAIYRDIVRAQARLGQHAAIPRTLALLTSTLTELDQRPSRDTITLCEFLQRPRPHSRVERSAAG
jgi:DNA-binding SARP family transcriptional activator